MDSDQLTLQRLLDRAASAFGDREVVTQGVEDLDRVRYSELVRRIHRLAHVLNRLGVRRGDRVGTLAWNHQRHLELYFAAPSSGSVLHTINLRLAASQVADIINHADDKVLFVDPDQVELAAEAVSHPTSVRTVVVLSSRAPASMPDGWLLYEDLIAEASHDDFPFPVDLSENEPAATCYSSATTGQPKGVVYSHRSLYLHTTALCMADTWALSEADTIMPVVPMFHVNAWGIPFAAVWLGATLVLPGPAPRPNALVDLIRQHRVTFAAAVPTVWSDVFDLFEQRCSGHESLRMVVSGGAPLPPRLLDRADKIGVPLIHSYGMTEASPLVLVGRIKSTLVDEPVDQGDLRRLRQGVLVPGLRMAVMKDGEPVPWDGSTPGELWLRGPWVAEEYERDGRTSDAFAEGWYHSGDIVNVDPEGYVQVVDRMSDLIKSGGEWISSIELENALMDAPGVAAAAVVSVPDERWDERPVAFVVAAEEVTEPQLREHLLGRFPRWWIPDDIVRVSEIPLTSVGKFDKRTLRACWPDQRR